jgi:hypothetical protein
MSRSTGRGRGAGPVTSDGLSGHTNDRVGHCLAAQARDARTRSTQGMAPPGRSTVATPPSRPTGERRGAALAAPSRTWKAHTACRRRRTNTCGRELRRRRILCNLRRIACNNLGIKRRGTRCDDLWHRFLTGGHRRALPWSAARVSGEGGAHASV